MNHLALRNRQRTRRVDLRFLRKVAAAALKELPGVERHVLGVHLVADEEMAALNETFLGHEGPTDVITFDHEPRTTNHALHGEIFICVDEAARNARQFRTTWQAEVMRYLVHGCLHLLGHDDKAPPARRRMKREEDRLMAVLAKRFPLSRVQRRRTVAP
jgi:probable rRNA maturation factor